MDKRIRSVAILVVGVMAFGLAGLARAAEANQPPELMTYQGYLVDANGDPLGNLAPANYDAVFRIYDVKQGGASLWAEQQTVTVDKGYFSVMLGEGTGFGNEPGTDDGDFLSDAFSGAGIKDRFIGVTVKGLGGSDVEIAPRLRFVTSPYAYTATHARRLTDESGNPNFFKEGSSLELRAGATTTLTLPDAGGATLVGALTADLAGWGTGLQVDNGNHSTTFGGTDLNAFNLSTSLARFSFNKPLEASSISFSPFAGLAATSGTYGSVMTTGSGANNNEGYSIGGRYNFMTGLESDRFVGTYNDLDDKWLWLYDRTLDRHIWHSDGGQGRLFLSPDGLTVEENLVVNGNLNIDERLGIGTTTPYFKLQINYDGNAVPWYSNGWHDGINFGLIVKNNLVDYASPNKGQMHNLILFADKNSTQAAIGGYREAYYAHFLGGLSFHTASQPSGYIGNTPTNPQQARASLTEKMRITPAGYVGIGTTSPWQRLHVQGNIFASGTITPSSDRRAKTDLEPVDPKEVLERVVDLPIERWRFKTEDEGVKHVGPMAQDFHEAFGLGESDTAIATVDADGVALAAIQGLNLRLNEKEAEIQVLREENESLKASVRVLSDEVGGFKEGQAVENSTEARLTRLEKLVDKMGQGL